MWGLGRGRSLVVVVFGSCGLAGARPRRVSPPDLAVDRGARGNTGGGHWSRTRPPSFSARHGRVGCGTRRDEYQYIVCTNIGGG